MIFSTLPMPIAPAEDGDCDMSRGCVMKTKKGCREDGTWSLDQGESLNGPVSKSGERLAKQRARDRSKNGRKIVGR